ncbi:lipopolysaccharide biosynthesis protein [Peribacillus simplex]|uniref:Polysaccharide biosynthesis protein n=1 Tax=Peribacillus simplex NBRC 15720 = DSM 1321 TaxID=1349754 RepID=A0A223ELF7_9BACI|nr:oligosaccharide flippase family protein [Peribacillus simplex]ASS96097.1 hypothetical protein BS1321_20595 [Peribacillus simplex NBRC 15720 = DSM 1321]MEC1397196.1 oligosaccharide flippase family protein [Peribacillus simplex]
MKKKKVGKILKNITVMAGSSAIAQIIIIAVSPIITRIYTPSAMGTYTYIISIASIIVQLSMLKYEIAVIQAKTEKEVNALIKICMGILSIVTILSLIILSVILTFNENIFQEIGFIIYLAVPIAIFTAISNLLLALNNRYQNYNIIARYNIVRSVSQSLGQVGFGLIKFNSWGLILSHLITCILTIIIQMKYSIRNIADIWTVKLKDIKVTLRAYIQYPLYSMPIGLIVILSTSAITFCVTELYGFEQAGQYSLSYRLLALPTVVLGQNIATVFFRSASLMYDEKGSFFELYKKFSIVIICSTIPIWIVLRFFSEDIFGIIFGEEWRTAGVYTSYLATMYVLKFYVVSLGHSFIILNKQYINLILNIGSIVCVFGAFLYCQINKLDIDMFFKLLGGSVSLVYLSSCIFMYIMISKNKRK